MKTLAAILSSFLVLTEVVLHAEDKTVSVTFDEPPLTQSINAFAWDLYSKLQGSEGNLFVSPYSISSALLLTSAGARGNTESQMTKAMHLDLQGQALHSAYLQLTHDVEGENKTHNDEVSIANALWIQKDENVLKSFLEITQHYYGAGLKEVDFKQKTEAARHSINEWVEKQTHNKIKNIIEPGTLDEATQLVLVNAVYFKDQWSEVFKPKNTKDEPFTLSDQKTTTVQMMHQTENFEYAEDKNTQLLVLHYMDAGSMYIFLPKQPAGLAALESSLISGGLHPWLLKLDAYKVEVTLPKFKLESKLNLESSLKSLRITDVFSPTVADLSGINGKKNLYLQAILHQAYVDVNEKGTEAAAATISILLGSTGDAPPRPRAVFRADHPFLFVIQCKGNILFIGRVVNPKG